MTADPAAEIIQEIALKHGIAVGRDDPILVLHTLNERLLSDSARAHKATLSSFKEELELLSHRWDKETKARAERILNGAIDAAKKTIELGGEDGARAVAREARRELEPMRLAFSEHARELRRSAKINAAAAALAVIASGLALWACRTAVG